MIKKILVSQPKPSSERSPYYDIAERMNVEIVFRPFIRVQGITPKEFRAQKISILDHTAVVFTSRHAIDHFFTLCKEMRVAIPEDMKYFCITPIYPVKDENDEDLLVSVKLQDREVFYPYQRCSYQPVRRNA